MLTKSAPFHCSILQRNAVSVSLCCVTNHPKMGLKTMIYYFSGFCELASRFLPPFSQAVAFSRRAAGVKDRDGSAFGMCGSGCWLLAGMPRFSPIWHLIFSRLDQLLCMVASGQHSKDGGSGLVPVKSQPQSRFKGWRNRLPLDSEGCKIIGQSGPDIGMEGICSH